MRFLKILSLLALVASLNACTTAEEREKRAYDEAHSLRRFTADDRRALRAEKEDRAFRNWADSITQ